MYRLGSSQYDALRTISSQGKDFYRALTAKRTEVGELRAVALRNYEHPFHFRPDTSDAHLVIQTLVRQEYGNLPRGLKAGFIIDAGANIGDSAVYFLNRFRGCRLVALEPHPVFSSIAKRNLACYPNATLIQKGLWSHEIRLGLSDQATGSSFCGDISPSFEVECVDIAGLLRRYAQSRIDILKLDIEGAEWEVISRDSETWLAVTRLIVVELHSPRIERDCKQYLSRMGFSWWRHRSVHYFMNKDRSSFGSDGPGTSF